MRCIYCGFEDTKVIDSRTHDNGVSIRRRRECPVCGKRFNTTELVETTPILVIKSNGNRQMFDVNKIKNGIIRSCEKRPVSMQKIDKLVSDIEKQLQNSLDQEVSSKKIGEMVMNGLKEIDEVAYVRFASVYRQFQDISTFLKEINQMMSSQTKRQDKEGGKNGGENIGD